MRGARQNATTLSRKGGRKSSFAGAARVRKNAQKNAEKSAVEAPGWPLEGQCLSRRRLVGLKNAALGGGENAQWERGATTTHDSNTGLNSE